MWAVGKQRIFHRFGVERMTLLLMTVGNAYSSEGVGRRKSSSGLMECENPLAGEAERLSRYFKSLKPCILMLLIR
jgi:hypothetical protein